MSEPLLGGVRPERGKLIEEGVGFFHPHLSQAFALVAELHPGDTRLTVPAVTRPDLVHPVLARDGDLFGLVVDAAGVRRPFAEVERAAPSAVQIDLQAWWRLVFILQA